ncbi:ABC transporter permease [Paenibacillus sp. FSL R7-0331]|uniref:ABC transporter permease n=1 Tax=Paenibacillus sp. FSL R7-0331 TaxID=1536773 RepID=UPI0004F891AF|nr:hypothetical protein [Paenibacillus sp. FSL R7-0331]AIQ51294.1 hypothetical protein R70331_07060 [Paenibacillus sp. FSL R7-0331]
MNLLWTKHKSTVAASAPVIGLILLAVLYIVVMQGDITPYNLNIIVNQLMITAVISTGAIFIFSIGAFDISLGAATAVSAMAGVLAYNASGSLLVMFLVCLLIGVIISLFNSILAALLNLPVFVTTIAMLSVLNSVIELLLGGQSKLSISSEAAASADTMLVKLSILILFFLICLFIFRYTPIGRQNKFLSANPVSAKQTGLSRSKLTIIAFAIAGIGIGLAAFLTIVRAPVLSKTTASSVGMDVLIALVFGGMPLSGGARSKISAALVGATSVVLLNQVLLALGFSSGVNQIAKGVLFLVVVFVASIGFRDKLLPR